eukprot:8906641-Pyramimonas_sp.AAC.1
MSRPIRNPERRPGAPTASRIESPPSDRIADRIPSVGSDRGSNPLRRIGSRIKSPPSDRILPFEVSQIAMPPSLTPYPPLVPPPRWPSV